jgi:pilus assembly protein CpaD
MTRDHKATAGQPGSLPKFAKAALLAGCASLLAGCYAPGVKNDPVAYAPTDYRQRHPIVVKERDHTIELLVGNRRGSLNPDQRAEVLAFARTWSREATGGIVIEAPLGTANAAATKEAAHEARAILVAAGIPQNGIVIRNYRVADPSQLATVRLNYPRMAAEAGPCGLWPSDLGPTNESYRLNQPYWNLGCASQRNLAAMVANPADLVQPRASGPIYSMRRTTVLENYRKGETSATKDPNAEAAKISEVGK